MFSVSASRIASNRMVDMGCRMSGCLESVKNTFDTRAMCFELSLFSYLFSCVGKYFYGYGVFHHDTPFAVRLVKVRLLIFIRRINKTSDDHC